MNLLFYLALLAASSVQREERIRKLIAEIDQSGCVLEFGEQRGRAGDPRNWIAPGAPPLFAFRYLQGADRGRFLNLDLMLDDAGH